MMHKKSVDRTLRGFNGMVVVRKTWKEHNKSRVTGEDRPETLRCLS